MPRPPARAGTHVAVKGRNVPYSFWPTYRNNRRFGLQSIIFARDPWSLIRGSVQQRCPPAALSEALACLRQAHDFYDSCQNSETMAARPLQMYYCFLNLIKSYCLTLGQRPTFDKARHGLSEQLPPNGVELEDAYLDAYPSRQQINIFDELLEALGAPRLHATRQLPLTHLLPQVVPGHRLWADAAGERERFISVSEIHYKHDSAVRQLWTEAVFRMDDLTRLNLTQRRLLVESRLDQDFRWVAPGVDGFALAEQRVPTAYPDRPADRLSATANTIKPHLWATVGSSEPFRRFYVYLSPPAELASRLPQLASIYAITYYLGSITRYRPHHFSTIVEGRFGARVEEFISGQPTQFLYLLASEFAQQDVARPSLV